MTDGAYAKLFYVDRSISQHSRPNCKLLDVSGNIKMLPTESREQLPLIHVPWYEQEYVQSDLNKG